MSDRKYSYSQVQTYIDCGLKYKGRYIDNLVPLAGEGNHDLRYGKAVDAGLNAYYSGSRSVIEARIAFIAAYPECEYPAVLPHWSQGKTFANGLAALAAYADHWAEEDRYWEVLGVQSSEEAEDVASDRLVRIDLVVRDTRDGLVYGVDHKATGKYLDKDFWAQFEPHSQIRQYVDRLQQKHGEIGGFYINALGFKHRSKAYTPRQGPDKGVQLPAGDWYAFGRRVFNPNSAAIQLERESFAGWVRKIENDRETDRWSYNTNHCIRGPFICEYYQICNAGYRWPRDAELITANYRQQCIRLVNGERCWLEPGHEGEHDSTRPVQSDYEVDLDEGEVEEAEV